MRLVSTHHILPIVLFWLCDVAGRIAVAFQSSTLTITRTARSSSLLDDSASDVTDYLAKHYPTCAALLTKNGDVMKKVIKADNIGFTIFAPNEAAFINLGEKKQGQLADIRNAEMSEKIVSYHIILEPVNSNQLFNSGGVLTEGGAVPAERTVSGGLFGLGGKEDGGVTLNGAKVVKSLEFVDATKTGIIHEVDGLISPTILWRYADQLRIPGST